MGSSEKTVKRATCFRRSCPSQLPCWRSAWLLQLPRNTTCQCCSSSATQLTTWLSSEELISRKPLPQELFQDLATSMLLVMMLMLIKRTETEDLKMMVVMTVDPTPPPPPPPMLHPPLQPHHHHLLHQQLLKLMCHPQLLQPTPLLPTSPSPTSPLLCTSPPQSIPLPLQSTPPPLPPPINLP